MRRTGTTWSRLIALICSATALSLSTIVTADESVPDTSGWKTIPGGAGTGCGTDKTPYEFYVHDANPDRIAIYFQGVAAAGTAATADSKAGRPSRTALAKTIIHGDPKSPPASSTSVIVAIRCATSRSFSRRIARQTCTWACARVASSLLTAGGSMFITGDWRTRSV